MSSISYRADIDGLRAVAVSSVVIYHGFPGLLPGGLIGVDIFFVISGYLITSIILKDIRAGQFSMVDFYGRRIRRIFPAICVVLGVTLIVGRILLFDHEVANLSVHALGSALFVANFVLYGEAGYFDTEAIFKPLLHMWSLAIEEQFYIVWPIMLLVTLRTRYAGPILTASVIASLVYSEFEVLRNQSLAFYSPLSRFWELGIGGLLAFLHQKKQWRANFSRYAGLMGAVLIVAGLALTSENHFPGVYALLPTIGAALIIQASPASSLNRTILSARPMVWLGKISYSLYLWHWPLISFLHITSIGAPPPAAILCAIIAAVILAWLSYLFVERPFRFKLPRVKATTVAIAGVAVVSFASIAMNISTRSSASADANDRQLFLDLMRKRKSACPFSVGNYDDCYDFTQGKAADVILIGDSHAGHFVPGFSSFEGPMPPTQAFILNGGCPPILGLERLRGGVPLHPYAKTGASCRDINEARIAYATSSNASTVILSFKSKDLNTDDMNYEGGKNYQYSLNGVPGGNNHILKAGLPETVRAFVEAGKRVILIGDNPNFDVSNFQHCTLPSRPVEFSWSSVMEECSLTRSSANERRSSVLEIMGGIEAKYPSHVTIFDLFDVLCNDTICPARVDGQPLYRDRDHLSVYGSLLAAKEILTKIGR